MPDRDPVWTPFRETTRLNAWDAITQAERETAQQAAGITARAYRPPSEPMGLGGELGERISPLTGLYERQQQRRSALDELLGPLPEAGTPFAAGASPWNYGEQTAWDGQDMAGGILSAAAELQMDPLDLATIISYETGGTMNPTQAGPTTRWGQHRGLIQFGEPQAEQFGVDWNDPLGSQLGAQGAIVNYFRAHGWQPGMSGLDAYSVVNAGAPGRYSASDTAAGGAPGDVYDKWVNQMHGHRQRAAALLASYGG